MVSTRDRCRPSVEYLESRVTPSITWNVSFDDPGSTYVAYHDEIRATLTAAGNDWGRFFHSANASIEIVVKFDTLSDHAWAKSGSAGTVFLRKEGNLDVRENSVGYEIRTGKDFNGTQPDADVTIDTNHLATDLWFDPTPNDREDDVLPSDKGDAYSVFLHELGHCLGFQGYRDHTTDALTGTSESVFDKYVTIGSDSKPYFSGPAALAANGNLPIPLSPGSPYHVLNADLMKNGLTHADRQEISALDIAILHDIGLPIVNNPPVIGKVDDQFVHTDSSLSLTIPVSDSETADRDLRITADTSNPDLISPGSLTFDGLESDRTLHLTPQPGQEGLAQITLHLSDGYIQTDDSFNVRVSIDPFPWNNPAQSQDVDDDGAIVALDALILINRLDTVGSGPLAWREPRTATPPYYDVHADNMLAADDVLAVINYINNHNTQQQIAAAESEAADSLDEQLSLTLDLPIGRKGARP